MSRSVKVKIVCALILGVILMFTGLFWYFRVYTKTPNYALKSIETALDTQDVKMFHRYVRLDSILDSGYDEFMAGMMEMDFRNSREDSAALDDFTKMLKPAFAKMLRDAIDLRLSTGEWAASDSSTGDGETENILLRTGLQDLTLRSIVHLSIDESGRTALADILSHQSEADADFTFKAELIPSENGDWQVVRIQNLYEYGVISLLLDVGHSDYDVILHHRRNLRKYLQGHQNHLRIQRNLHRSHQIHLDRLHLQMLRDQIDHIELF